MCLPEAVEQEDDDQVSLLFSLIILSIAPLSVLPGPQTWLILNVPRHCPHVGGTYLRSSIWVLETSVLLCEQVSATPVEFTLRMCRTPAELSE